MTVDPSPNGATLRILVVDDEPDLEDLVLQRFRKKIRDHEYEFFFASNGREALAKLDEHEGIGIVLTDLNMPEMDGLTLLTEIRERHNSLLKAVVVTAYGDMENIRLAMNRGAFDFITKPIDFHDLGITIERTRQEVEAKRQARLDSAALMRLESELNAANQIQQSILPQEFPDAESFDISARMLPARGVGGDFYDFFFIDANRLGFVIGDVSGKGMPAAIYMAVARTLVKAWGLTGVSPSECLEHVNRVLCEDKRTHLFVTVFYGIFHTDTGVLEFSNGGHNYPFRFEDRGEVESIDGAGGIVVGVDPSAAYETDSLELKAGHGIFLYTDGVTEAMDKERNFYGDDRLQALLASNGSSPLEELIGEVYRNVNEFAGGAAQHDDITMLAIRYRG